MNVSSSNKLRAAQLDGYRLLSPLAHNLLCDCTLCVFNIAFSGLHAPILDFITLSAPLLCSLAKETLRRANDENPHPTSFLRFFHPLMLSPRSFGVECDGVLHGEPSPSILIGLRLGIF